MFSTFADTYLLPAHKRQDRIARLFVYLCATATCMALVAATMTWAYGFDTLAVGIYLAALSIPVALVILRYSDTAVPAGHYLTANLIMQTVLFSAEASVGCVTLVAIAAGAALLGKGGRLWIGVIAARCAYVAATSDTVNASATAAVSGMVAVGAFIIVHEIERSRSIAAMREARSQRRIAGQMAVFEDLVLKHFDAYVTLEDHAIVGASPGIERLLGYSPDAFSRQPLMHYLHQDERSKALDLSTDRLAHRTELRLRHRDGHWVWVEAYSTPELSFSNPRQRVVVLRNYDAQRKVSDQLHQAQRLESMGTMAAAVAHDFNNMLTVILGFADMLPDGEPRREIVRVATNAADLTHKLLMFGHGHSTSAAVQDVGHLMREQSALVRHTLDSRFILIENYQEEPALVRIGETQLVQVLLNLVNNAREAMPDGGELEITLTTEELPASHPRGRGHYVRIDVRDTGLGMDNATLAEAFDPFFSTKITPNNTGLGLSSCYGIVAQYGGFMDLDSGVGKGTVVSVWLPIAETMDNEPVAALVEGDAVVLVIDDDPGVMLVVRNALLQEGYQVRGFTDPQAGMAFFTPGKVCAVVTDMVFPGASGMALVEKLRIMDPDLPALFISGFNDDRLDGWEPDVRTLFLAKPFRSEEVVERVGALVQNRHQLQAQRTRAQERA